MKLPRYPKYKPSGIDWLGEVPGHYRTALITAAVTGKIDVRSVAV